jgi:toxin ParE1/3/4
MMPHVRLTAPARHDIARLLDWSAENFGAAGRRRYQLLINTALRAIAADPNRAGSRDEPRIGLGRRIYHLRHSRERAKGPDGAVRLPRHNLIYRVLETADVVIVLRVLHDAMDLSRHIPSSADDAKS